jgi:tripartite-type tricarboxylate transporter receptor subunit TctC
VPYIKDGRLKALAVSSRTRSPMVPEVPTVVEAGHPKLVTDNYFGLSGPAALPADIVATLNKAVAEVIALPDIQKKLGELGITTGTMSAAEFAAFVARQSRDWEPIVRASGARL